MRFFQTLSSEYISMGLINIKSRWRLLYVACRSHFRHTQCLGGNSTWWACGMLICYLCHHHYHYWGFLKQKNTKSSRLLVWSTKKSPLLFRESTSIFRERVVAFFHRLIFSLGFVFVLISGEWREAIHILKSPTSTEEWQIKSLKHKLNNHEGKLSCSEVAYEGALEVTLLLLPDLFVFVNTRIFCVCQQKVNISCVILHCQNKLPNKAAIYFVWWGGEHILYGISGCCCDFLTDFRKQMWHMDKHRKIISSVC